jgi:hypothetical protein
LQRADELLAMAGKLLENRSAEKAAEVARGYFAVRMLTERLDEERRISRYSCRLLRAEYPSDEGPYRPGRDR